MCGRYTDTKRTKAQLASAGYEVDFGFGAPQAGHLRTGNSFSKLR
jgi:hypothetical protein